MNLNIFKIYILKQLCHKLQNQKNWGIVSRRVGKERYFRQTFSGIQLSRYMMNGPMRSISRNFMRTELSLEKSKLTSYDSGSSQVLTPQQWLIVFLLPRATMLNFTGGGSTKLGIEQKSECRVWVDWVLYQIV